MIKTVIKRNGVEEEFDIEKIVRAVTKAFESVGMSPHPKQVIKGSIERYLPKSEKLGVEQIQDCVEHCLHDNFPHQVAKAYILYREKHSENRMIRDKINYILKYSQSSGNAASNSNTDANANNSIKNVASIEPEVFKDKNRLIQRQLLKDKLNILFPEVSKQYEKDLEHHIIYSHDESNSPIPKAYCGAYTLYPLMTEGVGNIDNVTPNPPNDISSFSGQVTNLVFALSAQTKGAVALGDYIVALNYYIVKEFGENFYDKLNAIIASDHIIDYNKYTIKRAIKKGMKQYIYGINQPQGNRGYQSPFVNNQICDRYYFESLFHGFCYPDGSTPKWEQINCLQRIFVELLREVRLIKPCTFPVLTFSLLYDENGYKDKEYAELCAEEWAKGSSHFLYHSDNVDSLSSCCRVQNKLQDNYFTSTTGMIGLMTGSVNVITLNINRIVQDYFRWFPSDCNINCYLEDKGKGYPFLKKWITDILERVYKYHIAYKTMLYELEEQGMITYSNAGYLYIKKLYSTIGVIGYYEAAKFLGIKDNSYEYKEFIKVILGTISEQNKLHDIHDKKRPFIFNLECIPGEGLAVKLYNWDKQDNYVVPEDQNLYNCYFFNPWKEDNPIIKLKLHGKDVSKASSGGQGCHINLDEHLSTKQYLKLMDIARVEGCNYFTFNIPMSECRDCGHVVNAPIRKCPKCGSESIRYYTRIIGFLTSVDNWSAERAAEFTKRLFGKQTFNNA